MPKKPKVPGPGAVVLGSSLTAESSPKSASCQIMLEVASPMGSECQQAHTLFNVFVSKVQLVGPITIGKIGPGSK